MIQRPDFWNLVARHVHVHRADIKKLDDHTIAFEDGSSVPVDVVICATGFRNDYPFLTKTQHIEFGLPHEPLNDESETKWTELEANADEKVVYQYPKLANPPKVVAPHPGAHQTPNRLYNCIAPLGDGSIVFVGNVYVPNGFRVAETQAMWTTAYFDGMLSLPSAEDMQKDIAWVNALQKRRYPAHGSKGNYLHYDMMGYIDRLLTQIGLEKHKKGWWGDLVYPFVAADLKAAGVEYVDKYREVNGS
jgi:dimethylaniline monooxygenase (N-oxide forming)